MVTVSTSKSNIQHPTLIFDVGIIYLIVCLKLFCLMHTLLIIFNIIDSFLKCNFFLHMMNKTAKAGCNYQNRKKSKKEGK